MLELLAAAAGTTLVAAMATDAWHTARAGMTRLFGRLGAKRQAAIEAQLDDHADMLTAADAGDVQQVRDELALVWRRQMQRLFADDPAAVADVQDLVTRIQQALPPAQRAWANTIIQNITASGPGAMAGGAIGGNVIFQTPGSEPPQPVSPDRDPASGGTL